MKAQYEAEFVTVRVPTGRIVCICCGAGRLERHEGYCAHAGRKANALWKLMMKAMKKRR